MIPELSRHFFTTYDFVPNIFVMYTSGQSVMYRQNIYF